MAARAVVVLALTVVEQRNLAFLDTLLLLDDARSKVKSVEMLTRHLFVWCALCEPQSSRYGSPRDSPEIGEMGGGLGFVSQVKPSHAATRGIIAASPVPAGVDLQYSPPPPPPPVVSAAHRQRDLGGVLSGGAPSTRSQYMPPAHVSWADDDGQLDVTAESVGDVAMYVKTSFSFGSCLFLHRMCS